MSEAFHPCLGNGHWRVPIDQSVHRHKQQLLGDMLPLMTDGIHTLVRIIGTGAEVTVVSNNIEPIKPEPFRARKVLSNSSPRPRRVDPELAFLDLCLADL